MTIQELYTNIVGDHEQVLRVLRMDKLTDEHIRKLTKGGAVEALIAAGRNMEPAEPEKMYETMARLISGADELQR